jgi:hypothetical protein
MEKISQRIKYVPVSWRRKLRWKYYFGARECLNQLRVQKAKGATRSALDTIENHWSYEEKLIAEEGRRLLTNKYLRKADNLFVPVPRMKCGPFGFETDKNWDKTVNGYFYLTDEGLATVRQEIEKELKRRREARAHGVRWVSALTGLIGTITGLFAVLNK